MNDKRQFSERVEPFLSDEGLQCSQINLVDQDDVILYDKSLSKKFSNFFDMAVKNLYVKGHQVCHVNENSDPIDIKLNKYVNHPSIFKIKEYFNKSAESNFSEITPNDIKKEIQDLVQKKTPKYLSKGQDKCPSL